MLPYLHLTLCAKNAFQSFFITCFWVNSFVYHVVKSTRSPLWYKLFVVDCVLQIITLSTVVMVSPCYSGSWPARAAPYLGGGLILVILLLSNDIRGNRNIILALTCVGQALFITGGYFFACSRESYNTAVLAFTCATILLIASEKGSGIAWPIGHVALLFYIYHFWVALEVVK